MSRRVALGRTPTGVMGCVFSEQGVGPLHHAAAEAALLAQLQAEGAALTRIGAGQAQPLPARVRPPGLETVPPLEQANPPDVIGGWVRLWVLGQRARRPDWDGVICALEGDVSHWLHLSADEIVSSQSSLTPRLAAALGVAGEVPEDAAIADSLSRPERLSTQLRAAEVAGQAAAMLGHLVGAELAAMRAYWLGQQVLVVGEGALAQGYAAALAAQGVPCETQLPAPLIQAGLQALGAVG